MSRRPNVFSQEEFQASLRRQGCAKSFISPIASDFRLFVPVLIREIGEEKLLTIMEHARGELRLGDQGPAWREAAKYIVGWAEEQVDEHKSQR